jgi:glycosyltransferase involved in cell wall biosynthesis
LLDAEKLDSATPRSTVFHRPQQTFSPSDVALALGLGERFVLSQLDLIAYRNPGYFSDAAAWEDYRAASRHGLSAAERVVVFSEHTREELLADALVERERLVVVAPGLDHRAAGDPSPPARLPDDLLDAGFVLCLGTDFRHKNRLFALRLLGELRARHGWRGRLVLAGTHIEPGSSAEIERAYLGEHPALRDAIVSLGPVSEREKAWLIANSGAILYPSVYEGFGLVPFESALSGVPCVFAAQASLAEAAPPGTAAIVPWDPVASAAGAHALLRDGALRDEHVRALAERARGFTWDAAARATVEVYREAAAAAVRDSATLSRDLVKREARLSVQHEQEVAQLTAEREHAQQMYDALNAEVGFGLSLIGPRGALPESVQRALLALSARPALSRPLFASVSGVFVLMRAFARPIRVLLRRSR